MASNSEINALWIYVVCMLLGTISAGPIQVDDQMEIKQLEELLDKYKNEITPTIQASPKYEENVKLWTSMIQSMPELKEYLNSFEDCVDIVEELNIVKAMTEEEAEEELVSLCRFIIELDAVLRDDAQTRSSEYDTQSTINEDYIRPTSPKRAFDRIGAGPIELKRAYDRVGAGPINLKRAYDRVGAGPIELKRAYDRIGAGPINLKRAYDRVGAGPVSLKRAFDRVGAGPLELKRAFDRVGAGPVELKRAFDRVGAGPVELKRALDRVGAGPVELKRGDTIESDEMYEQPSVHSNHKHKWQEEHFDNIEEVSNKKALLEELAQALGMPEESGTQG